MGKTSRIMGMAACLLAVLATSCAPVTTTGAAEVAPATTLWPPHPQVAVSPPDPTLSSSPTVPESEMTTVILSYEWLVSHNEGPDQNSFRVTFPASWLSEPPPLAPGETPVTLRAPTELLLSHDEDADPDVFSGLLPAMFFTDLPQPASSPMPSPSPQLIIEPPGVSFYTPPGVSPPAAKLAIYAISGPVDWSLSWDAPWLAVSPTSGQATSSARAVTVTADAGGLAEGSYEATIVLTSSLNKPPREIPVALHVTDDAAGMAVDARIELAPLRELAGKALLLKGASLTLAELDRAYSVPGNGQLYHYDAGDLCLLLNCTIRNNDTTDWQVSFHAEAYNAQGKLVAWMLDSGYLAGHVSRDITANSSRSFDFHLNWAEDVALIKISVGVYPVWPPLP